MLTFFPPIFLAELSISNEAAVSEELAKDARKHYYALLEKCQKLLQDPSMVEDALQDTYVRMVRYKESYYNAPKRYYWLLKACNDACINLLRKHNKDALNIPYSDEHSSGPDQKAEIEIRNMVIRFLPMLNEKDQNIAILKYVDEMTQEEVSEQMNLSRDQVRARLDIILKKAKRFWVKNNG